MKTIKKVFRFFKEKAEKLAGAVAAVCTMAAVTLSSFAAAEDYVVLQASDLDPLLEGAKSNFAVVLPVGIGLMAISFGITYAITMLKKFKKG